MKPENLGMNESVVTDYRLPVSGNQ